MPPIKSFVYRDSVVDDGYDKLEDEVVAEQDNQSDQVVH